MKKATVVGAVLLSVAVHAGCGSGGDDNGGAASEGTEGGAACTATGGLPIQDGRYESSGFQGNVATGQHSTNRGSTVTLVSDEMCTCGNAVQVPSDVGGTDWAWPGTGVKVVWFLNQQAGSTVYLGADLSAKTSVRVGLTDTSALNLRVVLQVPGTTSDSAFFYCAPVTAPAHQTIPLTSFNTKCWDNTGTAFDRVSMEVVSLAVQIVTEVDRAYPFDFCVTELSID